MMKRSMLPALVLAGIVGACGGESSHETGEPETAAVSGTAWSVTDTTLSSTFEASGVARAVGAGSEDGSEGGWITTDLGDG